MTKKTVLSREEINKRVAELGREITGDYQGKKLILVGVLNGAFIFMADLARAIDLEVEIDFIRVASYGLSSTSSGQITLSKDVELDLTDKDVLLVEDIIDTGRTIAFLKKYFGRTKAGSVKICALIDKKERREVEVKTDYAGFAMSEGFLVGYGLDFAEQYRQLPEIYHLENPQG
jgi:hypoxanthine phosphoribosyltransferase